MVLSMAVNQVVVDKVKKLLALASDNKNVNEAQSAMEKARDLMKQHGIAMADVSASDSETGINIQYWASGWKSQFDTYVSILANATSKLFDSECWVVRGKKDMNYRVNMCFAGEETDIALCVEVWPWLVKKAKSLATSIIGSGWSSSHRSFCEAFACRIYNRADEMMRKNVPVNPPQQYDESPDSGVGVSDNQKYEIVLRNKSNAIQEWLEKVGVNIVTRKTTLRGEFDDRAAAAGFRAADEVDLNFRKSIQDSKQHSLNS